MYIAITFLACPVKFPGKGHEFVPGAAPAFAGADSQRIVDKPCDGRVVSGSCRQVFLPISNFTVLVCFAFVAPVDDFALGPIALVVLVQNLVMEVNDWAR